MLVADDIDWLYYPAPDDDGDARGLRSPETVELVSGFGRGVKVEDARRYVHWGPDDCLTEEFYSGLRVCCYSQRAAR